MLRRLNEMIALMSSIGLRTKLLRIGIKSAALYPIAMGVTCLLLGLSAIYMHVRDHEAFLVGTTIFVIALISVLATVATLYLPARLWIRFLNSAEPNTKSDIGLLLEAYQCKMLMRGIDMLQEEARY